MLGRLALSKKSVQVLRAAKGSVVGYAQRSGRRVVAGSRLAWQRVVPSAGSTGWCLVESPDDESPSGPRNEEGHGRWPVSLLCDGLDGRSGGCALRFALAFRKQQEEGEPEREPWLHCGW